MSVSAFDPFDWADPAYGLLRAEEDEREREAELEARDLALEKAGADVREWRSRAEHLAGPRNHGDAFNGALE